MTSPDRLMLDHSSEFMLLVDPATLDIVHANTTVAGALGYGVEQLCGVPITDIESALADVFYWEDVKAGRYQPITNQEGLLRRQDGELITTTKNVQAIENDGDWKSAALICNLWGLC